MLDVIFNIVVFIFIGIARIIGFFFQHLFAGIGSLIQQLTIKVGMLLFGVSFLAYIANYV